MKDFISDLLQEKSARPITITTRTKPRVSKECPFGELVKISVVNGMVRADYEKSVNKILGEAGLEKNFVAAPRTWGETQDNSAIVTHKGEQYLRITVQKVIEEHYYDGENLLDNAAVAPYLVKPAPATVTIRNYAIKNILRAIYNKKTYQES